MNQRVLVTAGASGIGREIARAFAANGAAKSITGSRQNRNSQPCGGTVWLEEMRNKASSSSRLLEFVMDAVLFEFAPFYAQYFCTEVLGSWFATHSHSLQTSID